ncbi:DNA polymerase/3'-5' exonuclease PolX [Candidatus Woesearchaeota archaeon]|nr:DNA polymerase/3'-5' exonuclease PolX [Candidatus Woesearchaeota archaeon]
MINNEIAERLMNIADIMEFKQIQWKPRAYRAAARKIEDLKQNISDIYKEKGKKGLQDIPKIGKSLADHIAEYIENGSVRKWEKLEKESPKGAHELSKIENLGPKKVKKLMEIGVHGIEDLKKAIKNKKIRNIEGFGKRTEKELLTGIKQYEKGTERMLLDKAMRIAERIINNIKKNSDIKTIDYAGSLRRMKETVGDIDLLCITKNAKKAMDTFVSMDDVGRVISHGKTKSTVQLKEGINVDLRALSRASYGSAMLYFTGSKDHNIELRKIALNKGYKLSEYGLYRKKSNRKSAGKTENEVYTKLGLSFIPPELRENNNEIEIAEKGGIPRLVEARDIKADLQMHTKYSDGDASVKEMAEKAKKLGYKYIAITDHSKSQRIAHGMNKRQIKRQWKEIDKLGISGMEVLKGAEVDILASGKLDYPAPLLRELDIVLAAVHSRFKSPEKEMTKRITKALENKYVDIFAHPTGRIIHKRPGYKVNLDKLFKAAEENNNILEINADPARLDLSGEMLLKAKGYNIKFSIGTDSHSIQGLENMKYGVAQARRGWLRRKNVVNTKTYQQLRKLIK